MQRLAENPFALLGATVRDGRAKLMELAEERALHEDPEACSAARAVLTNPRKRLSAEVAWLPGLSPQKASSARALAAHDPGRIVSLPGVSGMARVNVLAEVLAPLADKGRDGLLTAALAMADEFDALDLEALQRAINEDRSAAGFPLVQDGAHLEEALTERRHALVQDLIAAADRLPTLECVALAERMLSQRDWGADEHVPALLEEFVDAYELRSKAFLEAEAAAIETLLDAIRESCGERSANAAVNRLIARVCEVLTQWDSVAQPIQLLRRHQGIDHVPSIALAAKVRSTAVAIANEHNRLDEAKVLTETIGKLFAELPDLVDQFHEDREALEGIIDARDQDVAEKEEFAQQLAYETSFGLIFKTQFRMSVDGIDWQDQRWALCDINGIRWIGIQSNSGLSFRIEFAAGTRFGRVELESESKFEEITSRLWRGVGVRLLLEMMENLQKGKAYKFGDAIVRDEEIELPVRGMFSKGERVNVRWGALVKRVQNGSIELWQKSNERARVELGLGEVWNAVVLKVALEVFWKKGGQRLSSIFEKD